MEKLTNRQKDVLDYIKSYVANHGYPPAVREIGAALGLNSPATIQSHITALEAKGYIKKTNSIVIFKLPIFDIKSSTPYGLLIILKKKEKDKSLWLTLT